MSNGYGYEREPWMDKPSYNKRFSKKRAGLRREKQKAQTPSADRGCPVSFKDLFRMGVVTIH